MIRILAILLLSCNFAVAQISQQTITNDITNNLPTNNRNEISAELLRNTLNAMTSAIFQNQGLSGLTIVGTPSIGQIIVATGASTATWQNQTLLGLNVGNTVILNGTSGLCLYNNAGILGNSNCSSLINLNVGTTAIVDGTNSFCLFDNNGVLGTTACSSGGGGGGILALASPTELANATIAASQMLINVAAVVATGNSPCSLNYARGTSSSTGLYGEILNIASGVYWEPQYDNSPVRACQFGTVADGTLNVVTNAMAGTDNTSIIQAALDYAMQNNFVTVCLSDGKLRTTNSLNMGWGQTVYDIALTSCNGGRSYYGSAESPGIFYDGPSDRCAVNIQGARYSAFKGISLVGHNLNWVFYGGFPWNTGTPWPSTPIGWLNTSLIPTGIAAGGIQRYAPYGGICVDPFLGQPPGSLSVTATSLASFTGVIGGTGNLVLTTSAVTGTILSGMVLEGSGIANGNTIVAQLTGAAGGAGTYSVSLAGAIGSEAMTAGMAQYPNQTPPTWTNLTSTSVRINAVTPGQPFSVTWPGSSFFSPNPIIFTSGSLPAGLSLNTYYYITSVAGSTFQLKTLPFTGSAIVNSTGVGATGLTASRQYYATQSSEVLLEDDDIWGFAVNVNSNSSNLDANGDFFKLSRMTLANCVYCISIGNSQSRNVDINNINYGFTHTLVTNNTFGLRQGLLGGPLYNISGGESYQLFKIGNLSLGAPTTIIDCYSEGLVRIGEFAGGSLANSVTFNGCQINSGAATTSLLEPIALLEATGGKVVFNLNDVSIGGGNRIAQLVHGSATMFINGGSWAANGTVGLPFLNLPGIPVAFNYTGGIFVSGTNTSFPVSNGQYLQWLAPTAVQVMTSQTAFNNTAYMGPNIDFGSFGNRAVYTQGATQFFDGLNERLWKFASGPQVAVANLSNGSVTGANAAISSCDILTFTYLAAQQASNAQSANINTGDILYWAGDGTFFVVTQVAALSGGFYPITARQMNNMAINADSSCQTNNINDSTLAGNTTIIHAAGTSYADVSPIGAGTPDNIRIPIRVYFGDTANGSTSVTGIGLTGPAAAATTLTTYLSVGDQFWPSLFIDPTLNYPFEIGTKLSAVTNGTPGAITLGTAANLSGRFPLVPLPVLGVGTPTNAITRLPTPSASGGTCAAASTPVGNQIRGTFALTGACAATNTVTLTFAITAANGWSCRLTDQTAPTILFPQTGKSTTTAVFTAQGTSGAADTMGFECNPY